MQFQTEYDFLLPKGYLDKSGQAHRQGRMRLATVGDEINAMKHPKVKLNPDYKSLVVLASVIIQLDEYEDITPEMLESFYSSDIQFLQNMYQTINNEEASTIHVTCPHCGKQFTEAMNWLSDTEN